MIEIRTRCNDTEIVWQVELTVRQKRELHRLEAVRAVDYGDGARLIVNEHAVLEVVVPAAIANVNGGGAQVPALQNGDGEAMKEWVWGLPQLHLDSLALQIGSYVYTGVEPDKGDGGRGTGPRPTETADDGSPLVDGIASVAARMNSTPPPETSAEDTGANRSASPKSDG